MEPQGSLGGCDLSGKEEKLLKEEEPCALRGKPKGGAWVKAAKETDERLCGAHTDGSFRGPLQYCPWTEHDFRLACWPAPRSLPPPVFFPYNFFRQQLRSSSSPTASAVSIHSFLYGIPGRT